jgi:hypothetical protein
MQNSNRPKLAHAVLAGALFAASLAANASGLSSNITADSDTVSQIEQAENGWRFDPTTGDYGFSADKSYPSWDEVLKDYPFNFPLDTGVGADPFANLPLTEMPSEFTEKSLGGAVASTLGCTVVGTGTALACGASIYAAYQTAGFTATMIPEGCGTPMTIAGGLCLTAIEQWIDLGAREAPPKRHRTLQQAWSATPRNPGSVRESFCANNLHLINGFRWQRHATGVSGIQIRCTGNSNWNSIVMGPTTGLGAVLGTDIYNCGAGRTMSRFDVKHSGGRVTGIRPYCGKISGPKEWLNNLSATHFNSAAGTAVTRQCSNDHNAGSFGAVHSTVLEAIRLTCH